VTVPGLPSKRVLRDDVGVERPETRYAWNGDDSLAYQVVGDGLVDLVYLQGQLSNVVLNWSTRHSGASRTPWLASRA